MIAAVLASLAAIALGHPAGAADLRCSTVQAWPADPIALELGPETRAYTWFDAGRPTFSVYGPQVCGYVILLALDPTDRRGSALNGPATRALEGQAALSFLHELEHQALATRDEGAAECSAVRALPGFLARLGVTKPAPLLAAAIALHHSKPAAYRAVC